MSFKKSVASIMRGMGLEAVVESVQFRRITGAPLYSRHIEKKDEEGSPASSDRATNSMDKSDAQTNKSIVPILTVIVPAYNVEQYIDRCIQSILEQSYKAIEILIVNDGSTDSTPALCDKWARKDRRVKVIHKSNAGLGAARNTGLAEARGEYVTFVDSDDEVTKDSYQSLVGSLQRTGSDVAIGAIERFDSARSWTPFWVPLVHSHEKIGIQATDFPEIMWDVFAWNKVFRRSTWETVVGCFPEGVLYEDQECTTKLYMSEAKIDVLPDTVYRWRLRDDGGSITQNKASLTDLSDRIKAALNVEKHICSAPVNYREYWYVKTLEEDFSYYIMSVPRADEEFWDALRESLEHFWNNAPQSSIKKIKPVRRILSYLAAFSTREVVSEFAAILEEWGQHWVLERVADRMLVMIPPARAIITAIPDEVRYVDPNQLSSTVCLTDFNYQKDGGLTISGYGYLDNVSGDTYVESELILDGSSDDAPESIAIDVNSRMEGPSSKFSGAVNNPYLVLNRVFFTVDLNADLCRRIGGKLRSTESPKCSLLFSVRSDDICAGKATVRPIPKGAAEAPHVGWLSRSGSRWLPFWEKGLKLRVLQPRMVLEKVQLCGEKLQCEVSVGNAWNEDSGTQALLGDGSLILGIRGVPSASVEMVPKSNEMRWAATLSLADLPVPADKIQSNYLLEVRSTSGLRSALALESPTPKRVGSKAMEITRSAYGYAEVALLSHGAIVEEISLDGNSRLTLMGHFVLDPACTRLTSPTFALVHEQTVIRAESQAVNENSFRVTFSLTQEDKYTENRPVPVPSGSYVFELLLQAGTKYPAAIWVSSSETLEESFPRSLQNEMLTVGLGVSQKARALIIQAGPPLKPFVENSKNGQFQLSSVYFVPSRKKLTNAVVFESFGGAGANDSCKALDRQFARRAPEISRYWSVKDRSVQVPEGAIPLIIGSEKWFETLSRAQLLINNNNFPSFFRKDPRQFYLQTWHGTPLKRIGNDVPPTNLSLRYRALMQRETQFWDLLLAQSPVASKILARAFDYSGAIFDRGYPRNDLLIPSHDGGLRREGTRSKLGIYDDRTVVLYAPTWRDNLKEKSGRYRRTDFLGMDEVAGHFKNDLVVLYRGHSNVAGSRQLRLPSNSVIDVTSYAEVNDLILASDLLVTDYSSIMFDYCVTGKPIVFVAPDFDVYSGKTRGFYFDFEEIAPGPLLRDPKEAYRYLADPGLATHDFESAYRAFVEKFAPYDDGQAAHRAWESLRKMTDFLK